jgi:hypothetical protein
MSDNSASIWSAVAASFSAISSFLIYFIHRRNLFESVRPELVLADWARKEEGEGKSRHDVITFKTIRNVGRGPAIHVIAKNEDGVPRYIFGCNFIPIIPPGEDALANGSIDIWWKNVQPNTQGRLFLGIDVKILCWDRRGNQHITRHTLTAVPMGQNQLAMEGDLAKGLMSGVRLTSTRSAWLVKLQARTTRMYAKIKTRVASIWVKLRASWNSYWNKEKTQ